MGVMAYGAGDVAQVRLVRIALGEFLGSALGGQFLQRAMAGQTPAILDRGIQNWSFFAMASAAIDVGLGVQMVGEAGTHPRGELLLDQAHVIAGGRTPGEVPALQAEALAGYVGVADGALHSQRGAGVSKVNAGGEPVLLRLTRLLRRVALNAGAKPASLHRRMLLGQLGRKTGMAGETSIGGTPGRLRGGDWRARQKQEQRQDQPAGSRQGKVPAKNETTG